ncbi:hypothetical protein [Prosthecobacter vanneervenii]|uniref:Uncharacterized protein n=1 Tax=Prosthecobacter vanneervenii TaxID=48466 RepID=A0A7W7YBS1_9BACT|nr:hypothetical protein [Prosthecobacter vanneervenii]MBB5033175.1 hypothetical protein [Prosthecobacter vanneervenii]
MIWTLTDGDTIFPITDGYSRVYKAAGALTGQLAQTTQVSQPMREPWPKAFPDRSTRALSFDIPVFFPPCASLEEAAMQALDIPVQCPTGGVLTGQRDAELRTYSQAWVRNVTCENFGVSNRFVFSMLAVNPTSRTLSTLAQMDYRSIANVPAITGLEGGAPNNLDGYTTTDVAVGFTMLIVPEISGFAQAIHFRLFAGNDATQTDPTAGTLVVRPLDYDAGTNAKVWKAV